MGCVATILVAFLPWLEQAIFADSLAALTIHDTGRLLIVLTLVSAGIAGGVLLRQPATAALAIILIVLALAQLGLAILISVNILHAIGQADSHQVYIAAIGTGAYGGVLAAVITMAGGLLAWTKRRRV